VALRLALRLLLARELRWHSGHSKHTGEPGTARHVCPLGHTNFTKLQSSYLDVFFKTKLENI